jgi:hypothetical protein
LTSAGLAVPLHDISTYIFGTLRHFAALPQFGRFGSEADIHQAALTEPNYECARWSSIAAR